MFHDFSMTIFIVQFSSLCLSQYYEYRYNHLHSNPLLSDQPLPLLPTRPAAYLVAL